MKKLILGLFLTVSSSAYVLANNIKTENYVEEDESLVRACFVQTVINHETSCGVYVYSTSSPKYTVNCMQGQADGATTTYYKTRLITGWNPGSGPDQPSSCL